MALNIIEHDRAVRHYAMKLLADGYSVRARVEGWFAEPDVIGGYRPDIVAIKDRCVVIVEIEKGDIDWPKIKALETFASARPDLSLRLITPEEAANEMSS